MGNLQFSIFLILLNSAILGFFVLNFPFGKIFLGDGGAYTLGHLRLVFNFANKSIRRNQPICYFFNILLAGGGYGFGYMATLEIGKSR